VRGLIDPAMSFDGAALLEVDLGANKPVGELAGFDIERLHTSGDLIVAAVVGDLEHAPSGSVGRATDDHHQMGSPGERQGCGGRGAELDTGEVDPGGRAGHLAKIDLIDEQGGDDFHRDAR